MNRPLAIVRSPAEPVASPQEKGFAQPSAVRQPATPRVAARYRSDKLAVELSRSSDMASALLVLLGVLLLTSPHPIAAGVEEFLSVRLTLKNILLVGAFAFVWPALFASFGLYSSARLKSAKTEILRVVAACSAGSLFLLLFPLTSPSGSFGVVAVIHFWVWATVSTVAFRLLLRWLFTTSSAAGARQVLIVGSGPRARRLYHDLTTDAQKRHEVVGIVDFTDAAFPELKQRMLGTLDDLEAILMRHVVDQVLIALPIRSCYAEIQEVITICERVGVESRYLADVFQSTLSSPRYEHDSARNATIAHKVAQDDLRLVIKRVIDLVGAGVGLIVLAPLMLAIVAVIKLTSPGPAIFAQRRFGYNKRLFPMYKFRTMVENAEAIQFTIEHLNEAEGPVFKIKDDPRITPVGRFLRRTSLDELPQLVNVLLGDMSLVGPRPLPIRDVHHFSESWLMRRFSVLPGLTCLWQIAGRSELGFDDWVALDLQYIDQWSLGLDFKILLGTIPAVLRGEGAS